MSGFVHLHLHTQYSLLDGAIRIADLMPRVKELGMPAVAVTDHGQMYGAVDFYKAARAAGVKPIIGCETYVAGAKGRKDRSLRESYHLVLLATNATGYKNLTYLISQANLEGFYYHPRVDRELLRGRTAGLVALSACLGGEVNRSYFKGGMDAAIATARDYAALFEPGRFFLEIQDNGYRDQPAANQMLLEVAEHTGLPLVATADAHYLRQSDSTAHEVLMAIQQSTTLQEFRAKHEHSDQTYVKSAEEMWASFGRVAPQALENTLRIADMIDLQLELGQHYLPRYEVPEGQTLASYLEQVAAAGLERRFGELPYQVDRAAYLQRLQFELGVINRMDFPGYFLVVWDFIRWAKEHGIPVGPGRGSGAGSLVAYSLRITDLDPIANELLFERFLNPERVSMPDFDVDFCQDRRGEVIRYVSDKYGHDKVAQIVTFGQLGGKSVIKDVARVMGLPFADINALTRSIPGVIEGKKVTVEQALQLEPKLAKRAAEDQVFGQVIQVSRALEGLNRQTGMHAAGVVIGQKVLWEYVPLCKGKDDELVTQFAKDQVEEAGLVKFDFLGLKTLTHIARAVELANRARQAAGQPPIDLDRLALDDAATYRLIASGETDGVFQLESSGFKELLRRLRPDRFEDIVAAVALYRPGPLDAGMVDDYIERKHGRRPVSYPHALVEDILRPTYGVIVYQEQVMRIAVALCGFTMGQADTLRKAMGKKKADVMAKMRADFVAGAGRTGGMPEAKAAELWDQIEKFAGYAFNKSHSAAYALLSYQTAWLKHYHPTEFMAALLSTEMANTDNIVRYIAHARELGLQVLAPSVNASERSFSVPAPATIRFGLGAIKGLGDAALDAILEERAARGGFASLFDLCERVDLRRINRKVLEALVKSGALDTDGRWRAELFGAIERALEHGQAAQRDRSRGQGSLFDLLSGDEAEAATVRAESYPTGLRWAPKDRLRHEREALGFYLSGHPMASYQAHLRTWGLAPLGELREFRGEERRRVRVGGTIASLREKVVRDGAARMAFVMLEDLSGALEVLVPPRTYAEHEAALKVDEPIVIDGDMEFDHERESARLIASTVTSLAKVWQEGTRFIAFAIPWDKATDDRLAQLKDILLGSRGEVPAEVRIVKGDRYQAVIGLPEWMRVRPNDELLLKVSDLFGDRVVCFN